MKNKKSNKNEGAPSAAGSLKNTLIILLLTLVVLFVSSLFLKSAQLNTPPNSQEKRHSGGSYPRQQKGNDRPSQNKQQELNENDMTHEWIKLNLQNDTKNILSFEERIPSVVGHYKTQKYIVQKLAQYNFQVEIDTFEQDTVIGKTRFTNLIASHKKTKHLKEKIIFAAHYDSKFFHDFQFLGATDSVVSCAMLFEIARFIDYHSSKFKNVDFQLIFFDGEEAFKEWTETDSLYGSRHLAEKWKTENKLKNINLFVLLDLIGTSENEFKNHVIHKYTGTNQLYTKFIQIEMELRKRQSLKSKGSIFKSDEQNGFISDDHEPFAKNKVPILHLIPSPFPKVWHTKDDNYDAIDWVKTTDIQLILNIFISSIGTL